MQLQTLTFQAIGPFDGIHTIDFSRLGASGLFLLEGPTGAGKSTIIDAIVFALYGGLAGEEASKQRLHSHHAAAGVEPFVDLTFSTQSGDYRIRRSPAHERPKKSGSGTTTQNETAKLSRLASLDAPDMGQEISTRGQEIGAEIKRLVGLDKQQFLQTVVLPQGEFAKFLRSTGEERKVLLQTIFRTDVYEGLTEQLKAMRIAARDSIDHARVRVGEAFAGFKAASHHDFDTEPFDEQDFDALELACVAVAVSMADAAKEARESDAEAESALRAAEVRHADHVRLAALLVSRADLLVRRERVEASAEAVEGLRRRIDTAQRAAMVSTVIAGLRRAQRDVEDAKSGLERARLAYGGDADSRTKAELASERESISSSLNELERLLRIESALPSRRQALATGRQEAEVVKARISGLTERVASAPALIQAHEAERAQLTITAQSLPEAQANVARATKALAAAEAMQSVLGQLAADAAVREELVVQATQANEGLRLLRQRRLDGYAGELSSLLVPGESCSVCGSVDHPAPAALQTGHPTDADIADAERRLDDLTLAARAAADVVHAHERELARKQEQSEGLDPDAASSSLARAQDRQSLAEKATAQLAVVVAALADTKTRLASDDASLTQARVEAAGLEAELASLESAIAQDAECIVEAIGGRGETLDAVVSALRERRELVDQLGSAVQAHTTTTEALAGRQREVAEALAEHGFPSLEAAEESALDSDEVAALRSQVRSHEAESTLVQDGLARPDIAVLTGDEKTDVEGAAMLLAAAREAADEARAAVNVLEAQEKTTTRALTGLTAALRAYRDTVAESGAIVRLAGIAEGSHPANLKKVSLGTYVLMRRFDDVVNAANARYSAMSDGRYQLIRIEENEGKGGGRRTGLALALQDGDTGRQREPRTLSGGETFNASLCLALGLADVVTGEAGGIELGTLFVDEGFGTLDSENLDRVMAELGKLSKRGRMVGVVSHVDELKQRIADRIEVRRKTEGSSTLTVRAEGEALPQVQQSRGVSP